MEEIQRYTLWHYEQKEADAEGEWVRFEDVASQQAELERLKGALDYCVVLDNLYVGQDFTDNPKGSDAAHLRDIWRQMIEHVDCVLNPPSDAALNPPAAESEKTP